MGVDLAALEPERIAPADDARLKGKRVLVYLGTLARPRRIEVLFDMLKILRQQFPDALLVLVGEAEDEVQERWLRKRADEAGVADATVWTGWLPLHEGWRYVRAAQVGLAPYPRGPLLDSGTLRGLLGVARLVSLVNSTSVACRVRPRWIGAAIGIVPGRVGHCVR